MCTVLNVQGSVFAELGFASESLLLFRRADRTIVPVRNSTWNASFPFYARLDAELLDHGRPVAVYFDEHWDEERHFPLYALGEQFPVIQFGVLERTDFRLLKRLSLPLDVIPSFMIIAWFLGAYCPFGKMRGLDITDSAWPDTARECVNGFLNGSMPMKYVSEKVNSTMNRGPLIRLSGQTYWDFVNDPDKDVVVLFYLERDSESVNTTELEAAAAVVMESGSPMKFGFINMWKNSIEQKAPRLYEEPQVNILPVNNKTHGVAFFGLQKATRLLRFFKAYAVNSLNISVPPLALDEIPPVNRSRPSYAADYSDFSPTTIGDETRIWKIERKVSVDSRASVFFFVVDDDPQADQTRYLLKCVSLELTLSEKAFNRELANMQKVQDCPKHFPRIIHSFRYLGERSFGCIVMTYASEGSLEKQSFILRSETERRNLTRKMAETLAVYHGKGLVHDDVKLANFVLTSTGDVQLIDFESAWVLPDQPPELSRWGTLFGDSPERAEQKPRGQPSDAWALGTAIWAFWEGLQKSDLADIAQHGEVIPCTTATPPDIRRVITGLLVHEPGDRLTVQQVVEMINVSSRE
jgi:serine/threonine protein kinase